MDAHTCWGPGYQTTCLCVRGVDHEEALFDVPVGEEDSE